MRVVAFFYTFWKFIEKVIPGQGRGEGRAGGDQALRRAGDGPVPRPPGVRNEGSGGQD